MDALNLHPIITPLYFAATLFAVSKFWLTRREHFMAFKVCGSILVLIALAIADLWTGVAVGLVSLLIKLSAIWSYARFSITAKIAMVLVAFALTVYLQEGNIAGYEYLPLVTFLYGRSIEQFLPNRLLRIGALPAQITFIIYYAFAGRYDGIFLQCTQIAANLYTWAFRRDKLEA